MIREIAVYDDESHGLEAARRGPVQRLQQLQFPANCPGTIADGLAILRATDNGQYLARVPWCVWDRVGKQVAT